MSIMDATIIISVECLLNALLTYLNIFLNTFLFFENIWCTICPL